MTVTVFQESCDGPPPPTWVPKQESPPEGTRWQPGFLNLLTQHCGVTLMVSVERSGENTRSQWGLKCRSCGEKQM